MTKPTIKDVAKEAGVSLSTVSYAINNTKPVSVKTRLRIERAIEVTGYKPNMNARSLRTNKTKLIGIVIVDIQRAVFLSLFKSAETYLSEHGYSVLLCNMDNDVNMKGRHYIDLLLSRGVDGIIVTGMNNLADYVRARSDLPLIAARKTPGKAFSTVYCDNAKGGYLATRFLLERNGADLHIFTPPLTIPTYLDRMTGVFQAAGEMGMNADGIVTQVCGDSSIDSGYRAMAELLDKGNTPRTVFAFSDSLAIGALRCLLLRGIRVPQDAAIIGFDDTPSALATTPTLASVRQPMDIVGQVAARELINAIENRGAPLRAIRIEPNLIIDRGTV